MNSNIIEYIKDKYPNVIANGEYFCIVENNKIIGFFDTKSTNCNQKIIELNNPIFLSQNKVIPTLKYFYKEDSKDIQMIKLPLTKTSLDGKVSKLEEKNITKNIKNILKNKNTCTYNAFYDKDNFIFIENKYEKYIDDIKSRMNYDKKMIEICKKEIMYNINPLLENIQIYKNKAIQYFSSIDDPDMKITKNFYKKNKNNCNFLLKNLESLYPHTLPTTHLPTTHLPTTHLPTNILFTQDSNLEDSNSNISSSVNSHVSSSVSSSVNSRVSSSVSSRVNSIKEPNLLLDNITTLKNELEVLKKTFNKDNLYIILINGYKNRSKKYIFENKDDIIKCIKEYYKNWIDWHNTLHDEKGIYYYKKNVVKDILFIQNLLRNLIEKQSDNKIINKNIINIDLQLKHLLNNQLINLSFKENLLQNESKNETEENSMFDEIFENIDNSEKNIKYRLKRIGELLYLNNQTPINIESDKNSEIIYNFITLNNIFFRKQRVIKELNDIIINEELSIDDYILIEFEKIKDEIDKHVKFLNLQEIMSSAFLQYYKTKTTRNRIPESFYKHINNILEFWNYNKVYYRNQDLHLLNIIDDLIKEVKIYIRIKPLVGINDKTLLVSTKLNENTISLNGKTYNGFENVYPDDFTNLDIYIGKQDFENEYLLDDINFLEKSKTVPNGVYNAFNKLQLGYSIILYGKGISGSGTSYTLFGEKGIPGIVQYGLANLENVSHIKIKYLFEQYVSNTNDTFIKGNLHNLINIVPQLNEYFSIDETLEFSEILPSYINIKSLDIKDIDDLIEIIQSHRTKMNRIKYLPDGKSSRSNLYYVFEIFFNNGTQNYLTVIDNSSQDTPNDIYNLFIDSKNMKLENFMICNKKEGIEFVEKYAKNNIINDYSPEFIYQCIQESIYNNETSNHFNYYINSKNNYHEKIEYQNCDEYEYNKLYYFVNPKSEFKKINRNNNCLLIPILQFIEKISLRKSNKQIKYFLIYNIRRELSLYPQTIQTLNFTENITGKKFLGNIKKIKRESKFDNTEKDKKEYIEKDEREYTEKDEKEYTDVIKNESVIIKNESVIIKNESVIIKNEGTFNEGVVRRQGNPTIKIIIQKES